MTRKLPFTTTFELRIFITDPLPVKEIMQLKDELRSWLFDAGEESFVEGVVEGIDLEYDYENNDSDNYHHLGGDLSPISIYKYNKDHLLELKAGLEKAFGGRIYCQMYSFPTESWQEGWKASFKPILTDRFYIYPPWEEVKQKPGKISVEIDPGMAFGTGQHETTQLCLRELETLLDDGEEARNCSLLDVGTGSGILAIAAAKLGVGEILATDIDIDAVHATKENAARNSVVFEVIRASVPSGDDKRYRVVVANILAVILRRLGPNLVKVTEKGGFLVLSGILEEEADVMIEVYKDLGMDFIDRRTLRDWTSMVFRKRG